MPEVAVLPSALPRAELLALREALLASPYVAQSTLAGSFRGSRGFAITFTSAGRAELERRFPFLAGYLGLALDGVLGRKLQPLADRWLRRPVPSTNAYYLNLLVLAEAGAVGRHVDATLRVPSEVGDAVPERVSVLYLAVPRTMTGGELRLYRDDRPVARVRPREGMLLGFRGELAHEVTALAGTEAAHRVSLVCEQYALPAPAVARLAAVHVQSKAGFEAYLQDRSRRGS